MTDDPRAGAPRPQRFVVPAGLFAPRRRPPFALFDAIDDRVEVDARWLDDCAGETVSFARHDAPAFRAYLRTHLHDILATDAVPLPDRAWAAHRALLHELAFLVAAGGSGRANGLVDACRGLASFLVAHFEPDVLFRSLRVDAPHTPVVHGVETAIGAVALALGDGQHSVPALTLIACAGAVADLGLLDLPREVRDRAKLSPMEWQAIRRHPDLSQRRARAMGLGAAEVQRAIGHHHERWDGTGYPSRLAGDAIPVEARYVAIADAYAALTVARRGMPRHSRREALREMAQAPGQFDPRVLRSLIQLLADVARPVEGERVSAAPATGR
jgi:hypothetical protein